MPNAFRRPRWHLVYYALAAFDILTISGSLMLNHLIIERFEQSVEINQEWSHRSSGFIELTALASAVNAPGNSVFETREVDQERVKLDAAVAAFGAKHSEVQDEIALAVAPGMGRDELVSGLDDVIEAIVGMEGEANKIFDFFDQNQPDKAGERMNAMDEYLYVANGGLGDLASHVATIQEELFSHQHANAEMLRRFEYLIAAVIFGIVLAVTVYGHLLARKMARDEEEKAQAVRKIEESESAFRNLTALAPVGIFQSDLHGICDYVNEKWVDFAGIPADETGTRPWIDAVHADDRAAVEEKWREIVRGDSTFSAEFRFQHAAGDIVWVACTARPLHQAGNESTMYLGTIADITALKTYEDDLIAARDTAQVAERSKAEFLANMSHEIRTPMNGVVGMIDLLLDGGLENEQREFAETARRSADALLAVINDVLDFSKIESGAMELELIDFDLRTTVEDVCELLSLRAAEGSVELMCHVRGTVPQILVGDPGRLRQILVNLVGNAVKFTEDGEILVDVALDEETGDDALLRFEIRDTGIGIPAEHVDSIFDKFSQADASTTRKFGGTGLGLSICRLLAELMNGEVGVQSVEGKGSTFWFTARFGKSSNPDAVAPIVAMIPAAATRMLIVDDNETNRRILSEQLRSFGFEHAAVEDGESALAELRAAAQRGTPFDAALLDFQMPIMDGEMLARAIKADPAISGTELVLLTSVGRRGDAAKMESLGFAAYLQKPVKQSQLLDCLATVLGNAADDEHEERLPIITQYTLSEARRGSELKILLAEDNPVNQKVAMAMLKKLGYTCDLAVNGLEAVSALKRAPYDVVFMDCQMPEMDGYEATVAIRGLEGPGSRVRIIAMTANAMKGDREKCLDAGMDDYISKPIKADVLREALERNIDQERVRIGG